ncbi:condensin complex subunit 3-like [Glandiceps talaboti]
MPSKQRQAVTMREVFEECQKSVYGHAKLLNKLKEIYENADLKTDFHTEFMQYLKYSMIVLKREPAVERTLDFIAKFAVSFEDEASEANENSRNEENINAKEKQDNFLMILFNFFLASHEANCTAVRFRCCQMINKLLNLMGDDAQIDDDLFDRIYDNMLVRLKDKKASVRVQAVHALARLQDPSDKDCPVIKAYIYMLNNDPNPDVRFAILTCIAPSSQTLTTVLKRTRDVKDSVRKLAFEVLAEKIHIKALRIAQRVTILQDGLNDRSDLVKHACSAKLLQAWLRTFEGNILDLLNTLDVESSSDVAEQALTCLIKSVPCDELVQNFDLLNDKRMMDSDNLTCESALYWRCLCQYIKSLGTAEEGNLEKLVPTLSQLCDYVQDYMEKIKPSENIGNVEETLKQEFIAQQLLLLIGVLDLSDEFGRKRLDKLVHDMLVSPDISASLVKLLLDCFNKLHRDSDSRIEKIAEIVSDIREPITVVENPVNEIELRQRQVKLAGVRVELNQLRDELEECVANQDFPKAAEIKARITDLEDTKASLIEDNQPSSQEVRTEKNDPATLTKCLTIVSEMLQELATNGLNPTLKTMAELLIIPGIQNEDPVVRNLAIGCLGLCAQLCRNFAKEQLLLLMQVSQVDLETIRVRALEGIFDLLLLFGFETFKTDDEEEEVNKSKVDDGDVSTEDAERSFNITKRAKEKNTANSVLTILTTLLDSESSEIRTVAAEGLSKLLLSGRIVSWKLISRLVILWYNPITEEDIRLRHCLGSFLPIYAFASRAHQETIMEAFIPTLRTLINAPIFSPLAKINENNVADFLVALTNNKNLRKNKDENTIEDSSVHDSLAITICNEILNLCDSETPGLRTLCKALTLLDLTPTNASNIKDLQMLVKQMIENLEEKTAKHLAEKFQHQLNQFEEKLNKSSNGETENVENGLVQSETENDENKKPDNDGGEEIEKEIALPDEAGDRVSILTETPVTQTTKKKVTISETPSNNEATKPKKGKGKSTANKSLSKKKSTLKTPLSKEKTKPDVDGSQNSDLEDSVFATPAAPVEKRVTRSSHKKTKTSEARMKLAQAVMSDDDLPVTTKRSTRQHQRQSEAKTKLAHLLSDSDTPAEEEPLVIKRQTRRSKRK